MTTDDNNGGGGLVLAALAVGGVALIRYFRGLNRWNAQVDANNRHEEQWRRINAMSPPPNSSPSRGSASPAPGTVRGSGTAYPKYQPPPNQPNYTGGWRPPGTDYTGGQLK
jgi:hypothetical protein